MESFNLNETITIYENAISYLALKNSNKEIGYDNEKNELL